MRKQEERRDERDLRREHVPSTFTTDAKGAATASAELFCQAVASSAQRQCQCQCQCQSFSRSCLPLAVPTRVCARRTDRQACTLTGPSRAHPFIVAVDPLLYTTTPPPPHSPPPPLRPPLSLPHSAHLLYSTHAPASLLQTSLAIARHRCHGDQVLARV